MRFKGKVSFLQKHGSLYARASYIKDGQRKQVWRKVIGTKAEAKDAITTEIESKLNDKGSVIKTFMQLAEYYKKTRAIPAVYIRDEKVRGSESHKQMKSCINLIAGYFKDTKLERITRDKVKAYKAHMMDLPVRHIRDKKAVYEIRSASSVNQHMRTLRAMLNLAEQENWIDRAPSFKGLISSAAEATREDIPSWADLHRILEACNKRVRLHHVRPIVLMIVDTGARPVELWRLKWIDVDLEAGNVIYTSYKGKRIRHDTLPLSSRLIQELSEIPRHNEYVFGGIKSIKTAWRSIKDLAKCDVDLYSLRHFFATRVDLMPISQNQKQKLTRHTTSKMFGRYAKLTEETLESVRDMLNEYPSFESDTVN